MVKKYQTLLYWLLLNVITVAFVFLMLQDNQLIGKYTDKISNESEGFITDAMIRTFLYGLMVFSVNSVALIYTLLLNLINYILDKKRLKMASSFQMINISLVLTLIANYLILFFFKVNDIEQLKNFSSNPTNLIIILLVLIVSNQTSHKVTLTFVAVLTVPTIYQLLF